jgi:hypothetical protein
MHGSAQQIAKVRAEQKISETKKDGRLCLPSFFVSDIFMRAFWDGVAMVCELEVDLVI